MDKIYVNVMLINDPTLSSFSDDDIDDLCNELYESLLMTKKVLNHMDKKINH